jgi:hypothetical protein
VRFGVIRLRGDRGFELLLASAIFPAFQRMTPWLKARRLLPAAAVPPLNSIAFALAAAAWSNLRCML